MIGIGPSKGPRPSWRLGPQWAMRGMQLAFLAVVFGAWQLLSEAGRIGGVSPPIEVVSSLFDIVGRGEVWDPLLDTMWAWLVGLVLAVLIAVPIGFVLGRSSLLYRMSRLVIDFCRTIPSLALLPLALLLYGTGVRSKVLLIVFACVWPMLLQTIYGVRDIDAVAHDTFRSYRIRRRDVVTRLVLPTSWPYLATGMRLAATVSLLLTLSTEIVAPAPGLGQRIAVAQVGGAISEMYAYIFIAGLVGVLINLLFTKVERFTLRWHPSQREKVTS